MVTFMGFLTDLGTSTVEMVRIFVTDVATYDPLSTISLVGGAVLMAFTMAVVGYLALGAAADLLGAGSMR